MPGQRDGEEGTPAPELPHPHGFCCANGADVSLHGPPYVTGDLAYLPYGAAGLVVLDISDVTEPKPVGGLNFSPPFHSRFGVHGVLPIPDRRIAFANSENVSYGKGAAPHASIVDISDPANPWLLSLLPTPEPPPGAPYPDFSSRGGWSGPHNINQHQHHPDVQKQGDLFYVAHFNAGLRIYDVSNTRLPREVGYFVPRTPSAGTARCPRGSWWPRRRTSWWTPAATSTSPTRTRASTFCATPADATSPAPARPGRA
ncbi:LVIVD repeat-containing protein [Nonomuraea sp. NPDC004186]